MGQWSMHVEGHGIHDNGRDDDADIMFAEFVAELRKHHAVQAATFTVGSIRHMPPDGVPAAAEPGADEDGS